MLANTTNIINTALATDNELVKELLANKNGEFFRISTIHRGWAKKTITSAKFAEMVNSGETIEVIDGEVSIDNFLDKYDDTINVRIGAKDLEIRRISLAVKPKEDEKSARPKYRAYKADAVETTGIGPATAAALGRELQDGEIVNELISIQFENRSYLDSLWNLKIKMLENPNGFIWVSKKGELYITDGGDSSYKLFVADTWGGKVVKPQKANRTGRPGGYAKAVPAKNQMVPTFYRPAGRNGGTYMFVSRNLREEYETRLSGYTFDMLVKMAKNQKAGYAKFIKMMKYQDITAGAKKAFDVLDLNKYRIAIVNAKNHPDGLPLFGDGNFSAHVPGLRDRKAYQGRFNDFGKGIMKNNKADFNHDMKMVKDLGLPVKYVGNPDGDIVAIMDLNVYKFESNRPEGFGKNWLMKECVAGRMAQTHLKQLVRFAYHGINIDSCFDSWENALADKVEECFIPQPNSGYALSMLQGIESGATRAAVNKVLANAMKDVTIELGGNVITITQNRRFNDKPSVVYENNHKVYIVYANRKTCKPEETYLELRYPSTGLFEMVYVRVVNDDSVCDGCICCAVNEGIQEMLEILGGADADGDEIHLYPLTIDGKNTWLYNELNRISYKPEKIHNIMPSVARKLIPEHEGQFIADAILEGANQAGLVIGSANEILYAPLEAKMNILCNTEKEFCEYMEQFADAEEMSAEDIRSWIKYVSSKNFCIYSISAEEMVRSFDRDLMRVASWCAEVATGIASNGTGVPADIMWFFRNNKDAVNGATYNKNLTSPYAWIEEKINESIEHAREYASERIKQIDFCNKKFRKEWIKSNSADYINGRMKAPNKDEKGRVDYKTKSNSIWLKEEIEAVKAAASIADAKLFNVWEYVESYINSLDIIHANLLRSFLWGECGVGSHCFTREMMTEVGYTGLENLSEEAVHVSYTGTDKTYARCYVKETSGLINVLNDDTMSIRISINNGHMKKMMISDAVGGSNEITINGKSDVISGSSLFTRNANGEYAVDRAFVLEKARNADQYMVMMCLKRI